MYTGAKIPAIGLGTFGSDRYSAEQVAEAVKGAISVGYRHIDCASVYGNQHLIGEVLQQVMEAGIKERNCGSPQSYGMTCMVKGCAYLLCADIERTLSWITWTCFNSLALPQLS